MYSFSSKVRFSEVDKNKNLSLTSIINYFQDCSTFHGEDIRRGFEFLESHNRVWLLNTWQIDIIRYPSLAEEITTFTWPYDFKSMYGNRNFLMRDSNGQVVASANSIWVYFDTKKNIPAKITSYDIEGYLLEEPYPMEYTNRKIKIPPTFSTCDDIIVTKSNIDTNNHVNNGQYVKIATELLPIDSKVKRIQAEYRSSALLGDIIRPMISIEDNITTVVLANTELNPYCIIKFTQS